VKQVTRNVTLSSFPFQKELHFNPDSNIVALVTALPDDDGWWTADEFAHEHGITVRTLRYYASLGLLPAPERRGRFAYYGPQHAARLDLVLQLQARGLSMSGIERVVNPIPVDASAEDLTVHQAMLSTWTLGVPEVLTRAELDERAGRSLTDAEIRVLVDTGVLEQVGRTYSPLDGFGISVELLDLGVPREVIIEAGQAIERSMETLWRDLGGILREHVIDPYRSQPRTAEEAEHLSKVVGRLRALTTNAIVSGFHRVSGAGSSPPS